MYEWHIGDPVDWGDGFMDAQNQGYGNDDEEDDHFPDKLEADKYSRKHGTFATNTNMKMHFNILILHWT